jgi:cyanophycinase
MTGTIALIGSGAYLDVMASVDQHLLAESGQERPHVVCVPTATAQRGWGSISRYVHLGTEHFERLGAKVSVALVTDRVSASDPRWARLLMSADLIYFSGGNPRYLYATLSGTLAWDAVHAAWARGATLVGCSAGAMVMGQNVVMRMFNFRFSPAFGLIPRCLVWPHFNLRAFRRISRVFVNSLLTDGKYALGIDENTAVFGRLGQMWRVEGEGSVSLLMGGESKLYPAGSHLMLPCR